MSNKLIGSKRRAADNTEGNLGRDRVRTDENKDPNHPRSLEHNLTSMSPFSKNSNVECSTPQLSAVLSNRHDIAVPDRAFWSTISQPNAKKNHGQCSTPGISHVLSKNRQTNLAPDRNTTSTPLSNISTTTNVSYARTASIPATAAKRRNRRPNVEFRYARNPLTPLDANTMPRVDITTPSPNFSTTTNVEVSGNVTCPPPSVKSRIRGPNVNKRFVQSQNRLTTPHSISVSTSGGMSQGCSDNVNTVIQSTPILQMPASQIRTNDENTVHTSFQDGKLHYQSQGQINIPPHSPERRNLMADFENVESVVNAPGSSFIQDEQNVGYQHEFGHDEEMNENACDIDDDEQNELIYVPDLWKGYMDLGAPEKVCGKCGSQMWNEERNNKISTKKDPTFFLCCKDGNIKLPKEPTPPEPLASLLTGGPKSKHFKQNIRMYNCMFSFTSTGGKIDHSINKGRCPYIFKLQGQNYHLVGSLVPTDGSTPKFCQLYIYDTENEVENRIKALGGNSDSVDPDIVEALLEMLDQNNKLVKAFRMARDRFQSRDIDEFKLVLISSKSSSGRPNHITPSNEVAAFIVSDDSESTGIRDTIVHSKQHGLKRIYETDPHFMQLQYPLLFPTGDEGFHLCIPLHNIKKPSNGPVNEPDTAPESKQRDRVSHKEYYSYKLMIRTSEGLTLHLAGRLWQQYIVDAFTAMEQYRLEWVSNHQTTIRADLYQSVRDALRKGDNDPAHVGKAVILPASFTGSQRYMQQYFKDSLAICRAIGHPSLFLTMTCNTKWPEIKRMLDLLPNVDVADAPDIVSRVFKLKLDQLLDLIKKKNYFGRCIGVMHVIEFQKRGLPHVHMLVWLHPADRPNNTEKIDQLVSAEIPDELVDPVGYNAVKNYMIHGPCGKDCAYSPCMANGKCTRHFPKRYNGHTFFDDSGFPVYRRRRSGRFVKKKGVELDNQFVVPYNRDLLVRFQCHINLEICNSSRSLKYLFKYCLKGHDTATMILKKKKSGSNPEEGSEKKKSVDEIKNYLDGRYVCASEAAWRIFGFDIHSRWPSVDRLPLHLPGQKSINFKTNSDLQKVYDMAKKKTSKLEAYFIANKEIPEARKYTYAEFPSHFTWQSQKERWKLRQRGDVVGRLTEVHATSGDLLYLRMLLLRRKGALSFTDLRTVDGICHATFKEACAALGLLLNDNQWHDALAENSHSAMPQQLRSMFVNILMYCSVSDPYSLWDAHWRILSDDILYSRRRLTENNHLSLSEHEIQNYALAEIEKLLNDVGKSLKDFPMIPFPEEQYFSVTVNRLIMEETGYDKEQLKSQHQVNHSRLNPEQRETYDAIIDNVYQRKGGIFFVYGSGGCGKTFLWQTLCCRLRSEGKIVLPVATSGIAATLLPGGRTAHSRFHIPLNLDQNSIAGIKHGTDIAELIQQTSLIIWDEAPMQHRHAFEAVDRSLRDIMAATNVQNKLKPFGGITVVFGGDFRQILPVIAKGTRADIICAAINRSRLWAHCDVRILKRNMRLKSSNSESKNRIIEDFSKWQLNIGDGKLGDQSSADNVLPNTDITVPEQFVVRSSSNPIQALIDIIYPDLLNNRSNQEYLRSRAILTPTNAVVDDINSHIMDKIPGELHTYISQDSIDDNGGEDNDFHASFPVEYLNSINMPCLPRHELKIKIGVVVMLMRNLNQIMGLCNGTRMIVTGCKKNSIECQILCGSQVGTKHLIPRIDMIPSDTKWPFEFKRTQFPLQICFAMTINKSQGQSLDTVGIYLPRPVFCHGQLYVAISRVTSPEGLHILIDDDTGSCTNVTSNVVFEEVFYNLPRVD